jgi:autotransporter-associated beta strand protein
LDRRHELTSNPQVPDGTATFNNAAATTALTLGGPATVGTAAFDPAASAYTFNFSGFNFTFNGAGIANNSGAAQTFEIDDGAVFAFRNSATVGNSGAGSSVVINTRMSGSVIGSVEFFDTASAGTATINNRTRLQFNNSSDAGTALITNLAIPGKSSGTTTFLDQSSAGSAQITNTSVAGVLGMTNFGNFALGGTDTATAGNATIVNTNGGFTSFYGNTTGGTSIISANGFSSVAFFENSTAADATITITNTNIGPFGGLFFMNASRAGTAEITNNNGSTFFGQSGGTDTATADHAIINNINGGITRFFGMTTAGDATITTNNGSSTLFSDNSTGGLSRLIANAGGFVDFSGTSGPTGNNRISAGSIEGAGEFKLGRNELAVGGNNMSTTVAGTITDCNGCADPGASGGSLVKVGAGTLTLAGLNTYTGATTVNDGMLVVAPGGSILMSSGVFVNGSGVFAGTGAVPSMTFNGGTLSPGNSIGTLTISGSLVLSTASTYLVEVSPAAADRTNVTGKATIAGTVQLAPQAGAYTAGQQYVVLNAAGGLTGTFGTVSTTGSFGGNVVPRVSYDGNNVYLTLDPASVALTSLLQTVGLNANQTSVANAVNAGFAANALPADFLALFNVPASSLPGTLSQLAGELATAAAPAGLEAMNRFLMVMIDPFAGVGETPGANAMRAIGFAAEDPPKAANILAYRPMATKAPPEEPAPPARRWTAWAAVYGSQSRAGGDAAVGSHDRDVRTGNIASGFDYRLAADTAVGLAFSGGAASFALSDGLGSGRGDIYQAGAYGATRWNGFHLAASVAATWYDLSQSRTVALPGAISTLQGSAAAHGWGGRAEAGRRYEVAGFGLTPFAALQTQAIRTPAFSETATAGSPAFALTYPAQTTTRTRSELGIGADQRLGDAGGGALSVFGRAAWGRDFSRDAAISPAFAVLPATTFAIQGAPAAANSALLSAGALWANTNGISLRLKADGEFARAATGYAANATLRVAW